MFVDLGTYSINLAAIAYVHWDFRGRVVLALLSQSEGNGDCSVGETLAFLQDSDQAIRLREAFKQVPHIPVMGAHAKAIG